MTQDEIIEMALEEWRSGDQVKQAGLDRNYTNLFKAFAKLVAEKSPQRTWVGLTDEDEIDWEDGGNLKDLVKAIETKLKEKNT
jgi:hypothetical protein